MFKKIIVIVGLAFISCQKQKVFVPQSDISLQTQVTNFTPVTFLYQEKDNNPVIEVKEKGLITQTEWIFEVDKRLPLKLVVPEIQRLQEKKIKKAEGKVLDNYFTYMDTLAKQVAYMPFTQVSYQNPSLQMEQNAEKLDVKITREGLVFVNEALLKNKSIVEYLQENFPQNQVTVYVAFDENLTFDKYLQTKLNLAKIKQENVRISTIEVVY